jgi:hypothetical protein
MFQPLLPSLLIGLNLLALLAVPPCVPALDVEPVRPLRQYGDTDPTMLLPQNTVYLNQPEVIERYLAALDGQPPDWPHIYGSGDEAHMDRLFEVNRARDRRRKGRPALGQRVAFVWEGVASGEDSATGGLRLAVGPKVIPTQWGQVRFKPYGLPPGLVAVPPADLTARLKQRRAQRQPIDVDLILIGRLVPEESIIYDFAHEEKGQGMVMPVVQVERIEYFLAE